MEKIVFTDFPLPPTHNHLYATNFKTGRRFKSKEACEFEKKCYKWYSSKKKFVDKQRIKLVDMGSYLRVNTYFLFDRKKLFTKINTVKRLDAFNRVKAAHDALAEIIDIDDKHFFCGYVGKYPTIGEEFTIFEISSMEEGELMRFYKEAK